MYTQFNQKAVTKGHIVRRIEAPNPSHCPPASSAFTRAYTYDSSEFDGDQENLYGAGGEYMATAGPTSTSSSTLKSSSTTSITELNTVNRRASTDRSTTVQNDSGGGMLTGDGGGGPGHGPESGVYPVNERLVSCSNPLIKRSLISRSNVSTMLKICTIVSLTGDGASKMHPANAGRPNTASTRPVTSQLPLIILTCTQFDGVLYLLYFPPPLIF